MNRATAQSVVVIAVAAIVLSTQGCGKWVQSDNESGSGKRELRRNCQIFPAEVQAEI
ncbi:MAG: hypothetical protein MRJ68_02465 [Nitrospira sp.]|nr:hypothetical protein [Nitrospira sp.]